MADGPNDPPAEAASTTGARAMSAHARHARHARQAVSFGVLAAFTSALGQTYFIGLFGAPIRTAAGLSEAQFGTVYGLATLASGMLMFWLGALADRASMRAAITLALAVLAAGALAMTQAAESVGLLAAIFLLRLGGQGLTAHLAIVVAARHALRRGRGIATAAFGFILGEALFPLLVATLLLQLDWRWVWVCAAVLVLGVALPALRFLGRDLPRPGELAGSAPAAPGPRRRRLLRDGAFLAALSVVLVPPFVITAVFLHQGTFATQSGWSTPEVATGFVAYAVAQALATWGAERLIDHGGARPLRGFYLLPLAFGVLALAYGPPDWSRWALFAGLGVTAGGNSVISGALWAEVYGVDSLGPVRGVFTGFMVLASAASPPLLGYALAAGVSVPALAVGAAAYCVVVPVLAGRRLRRGRDVARA